MFDSLHVVLNWTAAAAFLAAFVFTIWTSPLRNAVAAVFWTIGALAFYGVYIVPVFMQQPAGFAARATWLVPSVYLASVLSASALFHRSISSAVSRSAGVILFLIVLPAVAVLIWLPTFRMGMNLAPFGMESLGVGILWFRIREIVDRHEKT